MLYHLAMTAVSESAHSGHMMGRTVLWAQRHFARLDASVDVIEYRDVRSSLPNST